MALILNGDTGVSAVQSGVVQTEDIAAEAVSFSKLLQSEWGKNLATNGYQKLPSGLILQWGTLAIGDVASPAGIAVTLPTTFPNQNLMAIVGCQEVGAGAWNAFITAKTSSTITIAPMEWTATVQNASANWICIGY